MVGHVPETQKRMRSVGWQYGEDELDDENDLLSFLMDSVRSAQLFFSFLHWIEYLILTLA